MGIFKARKSRGVHGPYSSVYIKPRSDCRPIPVALEKGLMRGCNFCCRNLSGIPISRNEKISKTIVKKVMGGHQVKIRPHEQNFMITTDAKGVCTALNKRTGLCTLISDSDRPGYHRPGTFPIICATHPFIIDPGGKAIFLSGKCPELLEPIKTRIRQDKRLREQITGGNFPVFKVRRKALEGLPRFSDSLGVAKSFLENMQGVRRMGDFLGSDIEMHIEPTYQRELQKFAKKVEKDMSR